MKTNEYGIIKDEKVYLNAFLDFPERQIGEVKESEETSLQYFVERFKIAEDKVNELVTIIDEATNKGSYLMKLVHLRKYLLEFDALGDYITLLETLDRYEQQIQELIQKNRSKNLEIKKALLLEAEVIGTLTDWKEATEKFKDLKNRWLKTGSIGDEHKNIEAEFDDILTNFFDKKKEFFQQRQELIQEKLAKYNDLIAQAEQIQGAEDLSEAANQLKKLQQEWKALDPIPAKFRNELWEKFRAINDAVFNQLKLEKKAEYSQKQSKNFENLIEKAEELVDSEDENASTEVDRLISEWKKAFKSTRYNKTTVSSELIERFYTACDKVTERFFVEKLCKVKFKGFEQKEEKDKNRLRLRILRDLYNRDEKDLDIFVENMDKFGLGGDNINSLLLNKHQVKLRKVSVKKALIKKLEEQSN